MQPECVSYWCQFAATTDNAFLAIRRSARHHVVGFIEDQLESERAYLADERLTGLLVIPVFREAELLRIESQ